MTKAFCVAGHTFHLELPDGAALWPLLTQYDEFVTEPVADPLRGEPGPDPGAERGL